MDETKKENYTGTSEETVKAGRGRSRRRLAGSGEAVSVPAVMQPKEPKPGKKRARLLTTVLVVLILAAGAGIGFYSVKAGTYSSTFLPNTEINGMDVSGMTAAEVKAEIEKGIAGYELLITERTGAGETIKKEEIGLHSEFDDTLETILAAQEPAKWVLSLWNPVSYEIETMIACDEKMLSERIDTLACMDEAAMIEPENAEISEYRSEIKGYEILPAVPGTELVKGQVYRVIYDAVLKLVTEVDLDAEGCYTKPAVTEDDEQLNALAAQLNTYTGAVVNHTFGDTKEVLDGDEIHTWLSVSGNQVALDESKAAAYVKRLAQSYDTAYKTKTLDTSYGKTVTITKGNYGWRINQAKETEAVLAIVKAGEQKTREPEYLQKAASHGKNDYGTTYVEINLTAQHLYFYKDGKLIVESDFVSGNESRGWSTPAGAYPLTYKQRNATLKGEGYETPVSWWMPFNGGIGLHDASWRGSFGGTIYKTNGSHGCINLPPQVAKTIYENISAGDPVLCYHLEGTASKITSKPGEQGGAQSSTAATTAAPTTAAPVTEAPTTAAPVTEAPTQTAPTTAPAATVAPETPQSPIETAPAGTAPAESSPQAPAATTPAATHPAGPGYGPGYGYEPTTEAPVGPGYQ